MLIRLCNCRAISEDDLIELPKTLPGFLSPFSEQRHEPATEHHARERIQQLPEARLAHLLAEQELMGEKLDESRVHEDARTEAVEDAGNQGRAGRAWVVRRAHAKANCDTYGCRDAVEECADVWNVAVLRGKDEVRQSRTNAKAFERFCDGTSVSDMVGVDGGYIRWKMMTTKRTLNLSSTAKVRPIRTLKKTGSVIWCGNDGTWTNTCLCKTTPNSRMPTPIS